MEKGWGYKQHTIGSKSGTAGDSMLKGLQLRLGRLSRNPTPVWGASVETPTPTPTCVPSSPPSSPPDWKTVLSRHQRDKGLIKDPKGSFQTGPERGDNLSPPARLSLSFCNRICQGVDSRSPPRCLPPPKQLVFPNILEPPSQDSLSPPFLQQLHPTLLCLWKSLVAVEQTSHFLLSKENSGLKHPKQEPQGSSGWWMPEPVYQISSLATP